MVRLRQKILFAAFFFFLALDQCLLADASSQLAESGCVRSAKAVKLEGKISSVRTTLKLVQERIAQLKREREWQELMILRGDVDEGAGTEPRKSGMTRSLSRRDIPVICSNMRNRIRLTNGTRNSGRAEVLVGTEWSPIPSNTFTRTNAGIVCASLGFNTTNVAAFNHDVFGDGGKDFLTDESCRYSVGVMCENPHSDQIRVVNGSDLSQGRVEIQIAGRWGTVCHNYWNAKTAQVACNMMGFNYEYGAVAIGSSYFGQGSGPSWMSNFNCQGTETDLLDCSTDSVLPAGCSHLYDAGVICERWMEYPIRLANGSVPGEGRVEIKILGQWGTVSSYQWDNVDAKVVCRMLGYEHGLSLSTSAGSFGAGEGPVWMNSVQCQGNEKHLLQCYSQYSLLRSAWSHSNDVGVQCSNKPAPVRLVNGTSSHEGRVEIQLFGKWGTVCDDNWDALDARVVCRQLGLASDNAEARGSAYFGQGSSLPILMDDVNCAGTEQNLVNCGFPGVGVNDCQHTEDAGVMCA